jgi:hypothetical protein
MTRFTLRPGYLRKKGSRTWGRVDYRVDLNAVTKRTISAPAGVPQSASTYAGILS